MAEALLEMSRKGFGVVGVVDAAGALVGIVTDGDLRRHMAGLLERRVDGGDDARRRGRSRRRRSPRRRSAMMNARKITTLFATDPGGARAAGRASCTCTTACAPAWSEPWRTGRGCIRGSWRSSRSGCRWWRSGCSPRSSWCRPTTASAAVVFSQGDVEALGSGLQDRQPDLHRHDPRRRPLPLHRRRWWCRTPRRRSGRRSPTSPGTLDLHNGPSVTVSADDRATSTSRPSGSTWPARCVIDDLGRLPASTPTRRRSTCAPGRFVAGDQVVSTGPLGQITSGSLQSRRRPRPARRGASLSETACGWYTIRRTPERGTPMNARRLAVWRCLAGVLPGLGAGAGRRCRSAG